MSDWVEIPEDLVLRPYTVENEDGSWTFQKELVDFGIVQDPYGIFTNGMILYISEGGTRYPLSVGEVNRLMGDCQHCQYFFDPDARILAFKKPEEIELPKLSYES